MHCSQKLQTLGALGLLAAIGLSGCATSPAGARFTQKLSPAAVVRANDETAVMVTPGPGVLLESYELDRVNHRIQLKIEEKKSSKPAMGAPKNCEVDVTLTRYDKGSAFGRAMLAGFGQIHINALVKIYALPRREKTGEFTIKKTFAWGGLYGASTTIEDAEHGFAEGIANALTGH
jgi:hypothetical protein